MSHQLGPVATPDQFDGSALLTVDDEASRIDMWVSNNPVVYRIFRGPSERLAQHPVYVPSSNAGTIFLSLDRLAYGIEFRSAVAGQPAVIACELIQASELPDDTSS